jgi:poly(3-hydroxybutyrate) depolymerase
MEKCCVVDLKNPLSAAYDLGNTAMFACKSDPRFHYNMYVPPEVADGVAVDLLVAVHGSSRDSFLEFRNGFAPFGKWNRVAVLCPIFPIGPLGDGERNGYKYMQEGDIRYDKVLLSMVAEVAEKYRQDWSKFAIFGFSGGGHFSHRFAILHPKRLWAACIGSPGSVTLLDANRDWWVGIRDLPERFGITFDKAALAAVPMQMIVGDADLETWEITHKPGGSHWMEGANDAGRTRPERLQTLARSFREAGVNVQLDLMAGVSHERLKTLPQVQDFLVGVLSGFRQRVTR